MKHVKRFKKMVIFLMAFVMIFSTIGASAATTYKKGGKKYKYTGSKYAVYYNSKKVSTKKKPAVMIHGNLMVAYKPTLVKRGPKMSYKYNKASKKLTLSYKGTTVKLKANKKSITINGKKKKLRTAPLFVKFSGSETFMIPAKAVLQDAFGFTYKYKSKKKALYITEPASTTNSAPAQPQTPAVSNGLTAAAFADMTTSEFIEAMGPVAQADYKKSGVLASVTMAQAILESGWGKSELAKKGNNLFGMKTNLSGNTWSGSAWDGHSFVTILTGEEYGGKHVTISAAFRKYPSVTQSVADHSAYLVNAKNGSAYRYAGLTAAKSYKKQLNIIKKGGYATSSTYVPQLTSLIERYDLDRFDK